MKKIVVTGGAGFLGSHLCDTLINQGDSVICLDNLYSGSLKNISHLKRHPSFKFINHDVSEPFKTAGPIDEIYNLACPASPIFYQKDPVHTTRTSVVGAINMLDLATQKNAKILQASTSEVYGDPKEHPQKESYFGNVNTIGIRGCYDEGKRCAETLFFDYLRQLNIKIKVVRIFNTYGPRMAKNDGRVVSNFIVQAIGGQDITIYGDGKQTRSFCYVSDLINGLVKMMATTNEINGPINLGNPNEFTMLELAELVIKLTKTRAKIVFHPLPQDDPTQRQPDISLAKQSLNWKPLIELEDGLARSIEYFNTIKNL
jgi:UDP-glucuronate decarboxylase